jgi:hypothetical protein
MGGSLWASPTYVHSPDTQLVKSAQHSAGRYRRRNNSVCASRSRRPALMSPDDQSLYLAVRLNVTLQMNSVAQQQS